MRKLLLFLYLLAICCAQLPICPNSHLASDIYAGQISLGLSGSTNPPSIALADEDLYSYNYVLPMPFRKAPSVAISVSDFESNYSPSFLFSIKYLNNQNRNNLTFLVRLDNRLANWTKLSFHFLAEIRDDMIAFTYSVQPNFLVSDEQLKSQTWVIPFLEPWNEMDSKLAVFLNGFQIYSKSNTYPNNSFELRVASAKIASNGIVLTVNCSSTSRVSKIYFSFILISPKATVQTVAFINQNSSAGETKYLIQPTGLQMSTQIGALNPADMTQYKGIFGLSSFMVENNPSSPRFYSIQFNPTSGQVTVSATGSNYLYVANNYLFFRTEDCSGCLGYNLYDTSRNTCVSFCPSNSFVELGQCKYCPAGQHLSAAGCVSCAVNEEWDGLACKCMTGFYKNGNGDCETCPAGTTAVNGRCQCPFLGQYFDDLSKTCNCPPLMYVVNGKCQQCESGKYWDGSACIDICSRFLHMRWDGLNCACKDGFTSTAPYTCNCNGNIDSLGNCIQCLLPNSAWNGTECACKTGFRKTILGTCVVDTPTPISPTPSFPFLPGALISNGLISTQAAMVTAINTLSVSVKLNNLPSTLVQNGVCSLCANIFLVQISLPNSFKTSIQYNGVSAVGTQSLFSVSLMFDAFPIQNFNVFVKINPSFSTYFGATDISQTVAKYIDLRMLALSESGNIRKDTLN